MLPRNGGWGSKAGVLVLGFLAIGVARRAEGQSFNEYPTTTSGSGPAGIVTGPDNNLWFTESTTARIGKITPSGSITEFVVPSASSTPTAICAGPDGNLWFTDNKIPAIGKITTSGVITLFPLSASSGPADITAGPDGNLWFVDNTGNQIGRITPSGTITNFPIPTPASTAIGIAKGSDNNLWFTELGFTIPGKIGRITTSGTVTEFNLPAGVGPALITAGPDGNLWFADALSSQVGRITTAGVATMFPATTGGLLIGIAAGPDGNLWFTDNGGGKVAKITTSGVVTPFTIPTSGSGPFVITRGPDGAMWFTENGANKIGRISVSSGATPNLTISKSAPSTVTSGGTLTYTITYGNSGSGAATGVIISDNIPTGATFGSASNGGVLNAGAVTWTIGTLNAGVTGQTVSFSVTVNATSGTINNTIYSIQATGVPPIAGSPISTTVTLSGGGGTPNLAPYKPRADSLWPTDWSDKIVIARAPNTKTDSTNLASTDTLYVSWAEANFGTGDTAVRFYSEIYVDGFLRGSWYTDPPLQSNFYAYVENFSLSPSLAAGTHTIRLKLDSTNVVAESNESDNEYTKTITVGGQAGPCVANTTTVCLNGGRFGVAINWQSSTNSGIGTMVPLSSDTAAVWFFTASNLEMMFKVVNGCSFNNFYWVFAGGLTNVKVTTRVTDSQTGRVKTYDNPLNTAFQPVQDTAAFPCQ